MITGGKGDLAQHLVKSLSDGGFDVFSPGRNELDVCSKDSIESYFQALTKPLELLILNAGLTRDCLLARMSEQTWDDVYQTNFSGAKHCLEAARPHLCPQRGHVISIASYSALLPPPGQAAYATAKAALLGMTRGFAREMGPHGVRANVILPGFLETKMTQVLSEAAKNQALAAHALGRFNTPEQVAQFILALHQMKNVSGQVFQLDSRIPFQ